MIAIRNVHGVTIDHVDGYSLRGAYLGNRYWIEADLRSQDMSEANLSGTNLAGAALGSARLQDAICAGTNFARSDLRNADLTRAMLMNADLSGTDLHGAILSSAVIWNTTFLACRHLVLASGLERIDNRGGCLFSPEILKDSQLPTPFLEALGFGTRDLLLALRESRPMATRYYTCFLSYGRDDAPFVQQLRTDLLKNDVICWMDVKNLRPGEPWRVQISDAIIKYDKLIVVCSRSSITRQNVIAEILEALEQEDLARVRKLFPIRLDDYVLSQDMERVAKEAIANGYWKADWLTRAKAVQMSDFRQWTNPEQYHASLTTLLEGLSKA